MAEPRQTMQSRAIRLAVARALWGVIVAGVAALGCGFLLFTISLERVETRPTHHAEGMVVLTGGADRVADAIELLAAGHADRLLITGVNPATSRESLERRLPRAQSLIACCVDLGYRALNTAGNAREAADWVRSNKLNSLIVVTSNYHMPRALAEIGDVLPGVDLQAFPVVADREKAAAWWTDPQRFRFIAWEYLKYVAVLSRQTLLPRSGQGEPTVTATRSS